MADLPTCNWTAAEASHVLKTKPRRSAPAKWGVRDKVKLSIRDSMKIRYCPVERKLLVPPKPMTPIYDVTNVLAVDVEPRDGRRDQMRDVLGTDDSFRLQVAVTPIGQHVDSISCTAQPGVDNLCRWDDIKRNVVVEAVQFGSIPFLRGGRKEMSRYVSISTQPNGDLNDQQVCVVCGLAEVDHCEVGPVVMFVDYFRYSPLAFLKAHLHCALCWIWEHREKEYLHFFGVTLSHPMEYIECGMFVVIILY